MSAETRKRIRRDPETTRKLILDATEKVMVEEGYAAVSSRRIAQEIALNAATIHYYFPTTDDIFVALHRRMTDRQLYEFRKVLDAPRPLEAYWTFQSEWPQTALGVEFVALCSHRKAIQQTLAIAAEAARAQQAELLQRTIGELSLGGTPLPSVGLTTILVAIGRLLTNEERVGIRHGHEEVRQVVGIVLGQLQSIGAMGEPAPES